MKMDIKKPLPMIIIVGILFIACVIAALWISGIFSNNGATIPIEQPSVKTTPSPAIINSSLNYFPPEIQGEIQTLSDSYSIPPGYWGFDPVNNEIDLLEQDMPNASVYRDLSGKKIGNSTIHIFNRTELETTRSEVQDYLFQFFHTPDYQISSSVTTIGLDGRPSVDVECEKFTPKNQELENTVFKGWKIHIYVCCGIPSIPKTP
jgi:hypothetical protein